MKCYRCDRDTKEQFLTDGLCIFCLTADRIKHGTEVKVIENKPKTHGIEVKGTMKKNSWMN